MKKIISSVILLIIVAMATTVVNATSNSDLAEKLYEIGKPYGMRTADKVRIERYLSDYPVTDAEANAIVEKAERAAEIMEDAKSNNYSDLTTEQKDELKSIANETADIIDVTLVFETSKVKIYKDGKLIEVITLENGKLVYTGNNTFLVVSSVAVVALVTVFIARKKFANA